MSNQQARMAVALAIRKTLIDLLRSEAQKNGRKLTEQVRVAMRQVMQETVHA